MKKTNDNENMKLGLLGFINISIRFQDNPLYHYYMKNRHCLDIGCGEGNLLLREPHNFMGVDINANMIATCQKKGLHVYQSSCTDLSIFADESFDVVNCSNIIEHLQPQDAAKMLEEGARVLKIGGVLIIDTPSERNVWSTFSHLKPYPPMAIKKLLNRPTETYVTSTAEKRGYLHSLKMESVYYKGLSISKLSYLLYLIVFSFFPLSRFFSVPPFCNGYAIILRKR